MDLQVVRARLRRIRTQDRLEHVYMGLLVLGELLEPPARPRGQARSHKVLLCVVRQGGVVECVLEMLEGKRVVQDDGV